MRQPTTSFPLAAYPELAEVFHIKRHRLTDEQRQGLESAFRSLRKYTLQGGQFRQKLLSRREWRERAELIERWLPKEALEDIDKAARGESLCPVVLENLPELEGPFYTLPPFPKPNVEKFYFPHLARALLFDALAQRTPIVSEHAFSESCKTYPIFRERYNAEGYGLVDSSYIHSDGTLLHAFGCPSNEEKAKTKFIHLRQAVAKLTEDQKEKLVMQDRLGTAGILLSEYLKTENNFLSRPPNRFYRMDINREASDPRALQAYDRAMAESTLELDIQPHQMVIWPDMLIVHRAAQASRPIHGSNGRIGIGVGVYPNSGRHF